MSTKIVSLVLFFAISVSGTAAAQGADAPSSCDRACLESHMNQYLAGLVKHDSKSLRLAPQVKYTENQERLAVGEGLWKSTVELGPYHLTPADPENSQIVYLGNIRTTAGWSMLAVRLRIQAGLITEIETIFPGGAAGSGTYDLSNGAGSLGMARRAFSTPLEPAERRDRAQLIWSADLHYEGVERGNGDIVPFGAKCIKIENGVQLILNPNFQSPGVSPSGKPVPNFTAMSCRDQFNTHIWETDQITDRRYPVVDEERGVVVAFGMYHQYIKGPCANVVDVGTVCPKEHTDPYTLVMAEAFKVRAGKIEEVESIFTPLKVVRLRGLW